VRRKHYAEIAGGVIFSEDRYPLSRIMPNVHEGMIFWKDGTVSGSSPGTAISITF
jgi:hypothetical protein